jgi:two-component system sensor histidine kinase QseC
VRITFALDGIFVDDQGPGVPEDVMRHLGSRFFRAPGQAEPGSGLGISIAKHIAHSHGLVLRFRNRPRDDAFGAGLQVLVQRGREG